MRSLAQSAPVLLVGEAPRDPPRKGQTSLAFEGRCDTTLRKVAGEDWRTWIAPVNLLPIQSTDGDESGFNQQEAASLLIAVLEHSSCFPILLLAGKRTAACFMPDHDPDYFERYDMVERDCYVMPHPSGANRWWNAGPNRLAARSFFQKVRREVEG